MNESIAPYPALEYLADRFGQHLVEEASLFILQAKAPNGAPLRLDATAGRIERVLLALYD